MVGGFSAGSLELVRPEQQFGEVTVVREGHAV